MATRLMSAPFRAQQMLVCGQLYESDRIGRVGSSVLAFLFPFGCRHSLLGRPVPPRNSLSSRSAYPRAVSFPRHRDGVSMFRTGEMRPVSGAPYTPRPWCSHGRHRNFDHHCRVPAAGPFLRCYHHPPGALDNEACGSSFSFALIWSSSCLWPVDGSPGPWAFSRASHPAVTSDACRE